MKPLSLCSVFLLCCTALVSASDDPLHHPKERRLGNIRQLTTGGTNAEAYFSFDESRLIFQSTRPPFACDQIFTMKPDGSEQTLVSTGTGRTTCGYFLPGDRSILFASTHQDHPACPPRPDKSKGYVWGVFNSYNIYVAHADGSNLRELASSPGYDAEATVAPDGSRIVFTSSRDGDLDLYTMNIDGSDIRRITNDLGYDGGGNFSWDGKRIVYRSYHPNDSTEREEYRSLLSEQLVRPGKMEIFLCNADGSERRQLTATGTANFAPIFHPDNTRIIFSSNMNDSRGRSFELFIMNDDGSGLEQITFGGHFNSFPMFTRDGRHLVFVSDRNATDSYEFNIFLADWIE